MEKLRISSKHIDKLLDDEIFVFGSNMQGAHGGGAARTTMSWGAIYGQAFGLQGKTFAIPTVDYTKSGKMSMETIKEYVDRFLDFAKENKERRIENHVSQVCLCHRRRCIRTRQGNHGRFPGPSAEGPRLHSYHAEV